MMPLLRNLNTNQAIKVMRSAKSKYVVSNSSEILQFLYAKFVPCAWRRQVANGAKVRHDVDHGGRER
jgi:hypothetical protein